MDSDNLKLFLLFLIWAAASHSIAKQEGFYRTEPNPPFGKPKVLFRDVFGIFLTFLLIQLVLVPTGAMLLNYYWLGAWDVEARFGYAWVNVAAISASAGGISLFCRKIEPSLSPIIGFSSFKKLGEDLAFGSLSWLLCFPVVSLVAYLLEGLLSSFGVAEEIDQVAVRYLKQILSDRPLFWTSFWLIIAAVPFIEEALFRGFLQTWLRQKMKPMPAILLTSAIFAGFHFSPSQGWRNVDLLAALFLLSFYLGILYEKRASIWAPIGLHMTFNAISEIYIVSAEGGFGS